MTLDGLPRKRKIAVRGVALVAVLMTTMHLFASFLWISPPTPLRELVPGTALANYMLPWFGQSWSVFAPAPINGDYFFSVRAVVTNESGEEEETEWVDATKIEQSMAQHNLFPPRAANLAINTSSNLKGAWDALNEEQQKIAELNYFKGDAWLGRMQEEMVTAGVDKSLVINYIVEERHANAYATQVAKAVWGDSVVRIQYSATRQNVVPFEQRNDPDAKRPPIQHAPTGWRGLIVMPGQDEEAFKNVFAPLYTQYVKDHDGKAS